MTLTSCKAKLQENKNMFANVEDTLSGDFITVPSPRIRRAPAKNASVQSKPELTRTVQNNVLSYIEQHLDGSKNVILIERDDDHRTHGVFVTVYDSNDTPLAGEWFEHEWFSCRFRVCVLAKLRGFTCEVEAEKVTVRSIC
jgi:hypothetical protein